MKISIGSDHGAFAMKEHLKQYLTEQGHQVVDCGTYSTDSGDCDRGIVMCTTGIGISIAANKVHGIRCALCSEPYSAEMTRRHNDANMLAMGGALIGPNMADRIVDVFLNTEFEGGRHARRVGKIMAIENEA